MDRQQAEQSDESQRSTHRLRIGLIMMFLMERHWSSRPIDGILRTEKTRRGHCNSRAQTRCRLSDNGTKLNYQTAGESYRLSGQPAGKWLQ